MTPRSGLLEDTLASFGVGGKVVHIERGPSITRYELKPERVLSSRTCACAGSNNERSGSRYVRSPANGASYSPTIGGPWACLRSSGSSSRTSARGSSTMIGAGGT
ncbi:MAG: hypothetical protein M3Y18_09040 [Candidatus Eremiobacteraeota bacterium]|nr:hypothetical protein [Candidatus Eremiobacteraeota bacterium]